MRIASIDIGKINFCFYIEEVDEILLQEQTEEDDIMCNAKMILWENIDITQNCDKNSYLDDQVFHNLTQVLDDYISFWDTCDVFLIEQQMSFGKNKNNTMAIKIAQHTFSYFQIHYKKNKEIINFPAFHKTQILHAPLKMDKPQRKKWAIQKAMDILELRKEVWIEKFKAAKKKDDLADVVCMLQAYKILFARNDKKLQPKVSKQKKRKIKPLSEKTIKQLRLLCKQQSLPQSGSRIVLLERLDSNTISFDPTLLSTYTVKILKDLCKKNLLIQGGNKQVLIDRLNSFYKLTN